MSVTLDRPRPLLEAAWRYGAVGLGVNAAAVAATTALMALDAPGWLAMAVVSPLAMLTSFLANRSWSFRAVSNPTMRLWRYFWACAGVYPLGVLIAGLLEALAAPDWAVSLGAVAACSGPLFLLMRYWVFAGARG